MTEILLNHDTVNAAAFPLLLIGDSNYYQDEIKQARAFALNALRSDFDKDICLSCSFGKDSLLCAVILAEALDLLNDKRKINLTFFYSGYEKPTFKRWFDYCCNHIDKSRFNIKYITPSPFYRLGVKLLGCGRVPVNPVYGRWCTGIKTELIKILNDKICKNNIEIVGTRAAESSKRNIDWKSNGYLQTGRGKRAYRIIGGVSTAAVWWYLERNLEKIGLDFELLRAYYNTDTRDGCWFCYAQKYDKPDTLEAAITLRLREYNGGVANINKELRIAPDILRTSLYYCKKWYYELLELQDKYNKYLLNETDKKYIFELWNIREKIDDFINQKKFLEAYLNGRYTMLYPELFDKTFYKKGEKYHYIRYDLLEIE